MRALKLRFFVKNRSVALPPIVIVTPERNKMLPIVKRPLSKKNKIPRKKNNTPKAVNPSPISADAAQIGAQMRKEIDKPMLSINRPIAAVRDLVHKNKIKNRRCRKY